MGEFTRTSSGKRFLLFLLFLIATALSVFLDIPVLRELLSFLFLTFVPGALLLYILKLNKLGLTVKTVLSLGLSISFLMFFGLLINWVYPLFGYSSPLSTNSLLISFGVITLVLAVIAYWRNRDASFASLSDFKLSVREKIYLLLPAIFPLLSILSMHLMNTTGSNLGLIVLLSLIPAYIIFIAISNQKVASRLYPPLIFFTGVSLCLMLAMRSTHIVGTDAHLEYYLFQQTYNELHWRIFEPGSPVSACLSVTLLPTIYQSLLNINSEYLMKVLYPLLFSVSPLIVYLLSRKYIGDFYSFLAALFFISQVIFLSAAGNPRTTMAILFFSLSMMVLFLRGLSDFDRILLFIVFAASCIVSHYSTTYIFFFVLLFTWIGTQLLSWLNRRRRLAAANSEGDPPASPSKNRSGGNIAPPKALPSWSTRFKSHVTITAVALFFVMLFLWYSQLTTASFTSGVKFISSTFQNLRQFFILESRGAGGLLLGQGVQYLGVPQKIEWVFSWLTILFIAIGVLALLISYYRRATVSSGKEISLTLDKVNTEYLALGLSCALILFISIALPRILTGYGMQRTYGQMMTILAPLFVLGGITLARFLKAKPYWLIPIVLIPYFMCTTTLVYQAFGVPRDITLNDAGSDYNLYYVHEQETYASQWLGEHSKEESRMYADHGGHSRLISQGGISIYSINNVVPSLEEGREIDGYIYLRYYNVVDGKLIGPEHIEYELEDYWQKLAKRDKIYTNEGSEIWR